MHSYGESMVANDIDTLKGGLINGGHEQWASVIVRPYPYFVIDLDGRYEVEGSLCQTKLRYGLPLDENLSTNVYLRAPLFFSSIYSWNIWRWRL